MTPVIDIRDAIKTYRLGEVEVHALRGVSFQVGRGEFVAIMGASGSGKSTLMNVIGCLDRPTGGRYFLERVDVASLEEPELARIRSERIGFVFQNFNLLARTSAAENVALPLFYAGRMAGSAERARKALAAIGLGGRERNHPGQLSGGQQQRVAIARALVNDPAILLADEPTGNLDTRTAEDIMALLQSFNRRNGLTIVMVTHEANIAAYADRVITMRDGLIVSDERQTARVAPEWPAATMPEGAPVTAKEDAGTGIAFGRMALAAAWRALMRNKMRSALTMLGVFIGVAALIAMVAVGQGASASVRAQIESLGTNLIIVIPGATTASGVRAGFGSASTLTVADSEAIRREIPSVSNVSVLTRQLAQVQYGNQNWSTSVQGVSASYAALRNWKITDGRDFTERDEQGAARVALIGQTAANALFGEHQSPAGATIMIKNVPVEIIGVLAPRGQSGFGQDQDDVVLLPFPAAERKVLGVSSPVTAQSNPYIRSGPSNPFGLKPRLTGYVNMIYVQARATKDVPETLERVKQLLRRRHHIQEGQTDDFGVRNLSEMTEAAESSSRIMALLLAAVASISLLVGGIGIMNILLVSVTERTREIGIRMAIGARRAHVLMQFLVESMLLSLVGGGAGILAGAGISFAISRLAGWPILLPPFAIAGAFLFSAAVGIFFGYYPARRASRLNPIEALRFE